MIVNYLQKNLRNINLNEIIKFAMEYLNFEKNKLDLDKIVNDKHNEEEIKNLAKIEIEEVVSKHKENETKLKIFLLPKDEADSKNAILEIRAGTGGLEPAYLLLIFQNV